MLGCEAWLWQEVNRVPPWAQQALGRDAVEQEARVAAMKAAHDFDPLAFPGVPFGAFARMGVRFHLRGVAQKLATKYRVWAAMPVGNEDDESIAHQIPDHRDPAPERLLRAWCDEGYARQRKCLDMRTRVVLYLRTVEGWTLVEVGDGLGITRARVQQLEARAVRKLAAFRVRRSRQATAKEPT